MCLQVLGISTAYVKQVVWSDEASSVYRSIAKLDCWNQQSISQPCTPITVQLKTKWSNQSRRSRDIDFCYWLISMTAIYQIACTLKPTKGFILLFFFHTQQSSPRPFNTFNWWQSRLKAFKGKFLSTLSVNFFSFFLVVNNRGLAWIIIIVSYNQALFSLFSNARKSDCWHDNK